MLFIIPVSFADNSATVFQSSALQTNVIEVFTSEGCSSCPPADRWLSTFKDHPDLFTQVIPMAFHVDYWDWLGWQDPFASPWFSKRQRDYVKQRNLSQAYTPGILVNSQEWRVWFKGERDWPESEAEPGVLTLTVDGTQAWVEFNSDSPLNVHFAVLGIGIESDVKNGENRGKSLTHDFVVLHHESRTLSADASFTLPDREDYTNAEKLAVVGWVSARDRIEIIQAAAGYWPEL